MMTADVYGFLNQFPDESYDIRVTKDARYVDQKCTPDIVCFIADCILSTSCASNPFTCNDLWNEKYFVDNCQVIFGKPSPENQEARNEYNKVLCQPLKLLAYAHVLNEESVKGSLTFSVQDKGMLEYIAIKERNAYDFLYAFFMKVMECSGFARHFREYKRQCDDAARLDPKQAKGVVIVAKKLIYKKYHEFIAAHTPSKSVLDANRMFHKVFNIYAFHEQLPGSNGKRAAWYDLMYNRINFRDKGRKDKSLTRGEAAAAGITTMNESYYIKYQVDKAKRLVHKLQGDRSEVHDEDGDGKATEFHHIFPVAGFPTIASYTENLILLTSNQHRIKAHPNSNFQMVDKDYQFVCLMAKSDTIEKYLSDVNGGVYRKDSFVDVINTGFTDGILDAKSSFADIRKYLISYHSTH